MKRLDYLRKTEERLGAALEQLGERPPAHTLASMAKLIVDGTTGPWRYFHTPDHLFMVAGDEDPVEMLAGLYHDLLYVQVDRTIFLNLACQISAVVYQNGDKLFIRSGKHLPDDLALSLTMALFDFTPGQMLDPLAGQNEFLSAVVAARVLAPLLNLADLAGVLACVELTIPFRKRDSEGNGPSELLFKRLMAADERFGLTLGQAGCEAAVHRAVRLCIRDISGFNLPTAPFMDNTWCLLPETNNTLVRTPGYSVRTYRQSLTGTHDFFGRLDPADIFPHFMGTPDSQTCAELQAAAGHNLEVGYLYLTAKLAALAVLEALAERVGAEIPVSLLLGGREENQASEIEVSELAPDASTLDRRVFDLLVHGRTQDQAYDLTNSPVAATFFSFLGSAGIKSLYTQATAYFGGDISADELIAYTPPELVARIKDRILALMASRMEALRREP